MENEDVNSQLSQLNLEETQHDSQQGNEPESSAQAASEKVVEPAEDDDDDDDGWITPSNLKKHQAKDAQVAVPSEAIQETLQAALLTSDFAMQNVALRINLKYVSTCITRRRRSYSATRPSRSVVVRPC